MKLLMSCVIFQGLNLQLLYLLNVVWRKKIISLCVSSRNDVGGI